MARLPSAAAWSGGRKFASDFAANFAVKLRAAAHGASVFQLRDPVVADRHVSTARGVQAGARVVDPAGRYLHIPQLAHRFRDIAPCQWRHRHVPYPPSRNSHHFHVIKLLRSFAQPPST